MNLVVVTNIEAVKHLNVPIIKTAHHTPAFIEEDEVTHQNFTSPHGLLHPIVPESSTMINQDLEMVNMLKI